MDQTRRWGEREPLANDTREEARERDGGATPLWRALLQRKLANRRAQRKRAGREGGEAAGDGDVVHAAAARGLEGAGGALPHLPRIQQAFGRRDVGGVEAHVGGPATEAAAEMGAVAYASGHQVAFAGAPD